MSDQTFPEFIEPEILTQVHSLYLQGFSEEEIHYRMELDTKYALTAKEISDIIDYINSLYI